jgi:hypothetical protein
LSDIGGMVEELIAAGTPPAIAARVVAQAFSAGVLSAPERRQSADETADRRRDRDRIYRAERRAKDKLSDDNRTTSAESSDSADSALTLKNLDKKVRAKKIPCPPTWAPNESHFAKAAEKNIPQSAVLEKAEDMRLWAQSSGALKMDWDATFHGFLRRDADRLRVGAPVPIVRLVEPDEAAVQRFQKMHRWHRDYGPEPGMPGCKAPPDILQKYGYEPKAA